MQEQHKHQIHSVTRKPPVVMQIQPVAAFQISTHRHIPTAVAGLVIDGNKNTSFNIESTVMCQATETETNPWLAIDLGEKFHVQRVEVTNRQDCCSERATNLQVGVTNTPPEVGRGYDMDRNTLCGWKEGRMGAVGVIYCPDYISGRFVVVQFETVDIMNICEIEIFGYK